MERVEELEQQIAAIKAELFALGDMRPGSLTAAYTSCGNKGCRCHDQHEPHPHGPYWRISYTRKGRGHTEFVSRQRLNQVRRETENYQRFRELTEQWVDCSLALVKARQSGDKSKPQPKGSADGCNDQA